MALKITRDQDSFDDFLEITSGLGGGSHYWALGGAYKWNGAAVYQVIAEVNAGGQYLRLEVGPAGLALLYNNASQVSGSIQLTADQYTYFGIDYSASAETATLYYWRDNGTDSGMTGLSPMYGAAPLTPGSLVLGCNDIAGSRSARGSRSHWRYFNAGETSSTGSPVAILGASGWNTERLSATAVKTTGLIDSWKLVTNGNGDSGLNFTTTGSVTFEADEPSWLSGGTVTLTVQDSAHGHSAENVTLSTQLTLAVNDALHAHSADLVTLLARRFEMTLTYPDGSPAASLTGLWWRYYTSIAAMASGAPLAYGSGATTDGSGLFSVDAPGSMSPGDDQGFGIISNQDATPDSTEGAYVGAFDVV